MYLQALSNKNMNSGKKDIDIIFYSDNCAGQNKNRFILTLYMFALSYFENINSITHKFLVSGHTQNENDSAHSVIERSIKKYRKSSPIFVPDQYVSIIRQAKKTGKPYEVQELCHDDFFDLKKLAAQIGIKDIIKSDDRVFKLSETRVWKLEKNSYGKLFYKLSFDEAEFSCIEMLKSKSSNKVQLSKAYKSKIHLTKAKKQGIISLIDKKVVPEYYREFYEKC